MSMRKTALAPGQLLRSVHIGEKLPRQGGNPLLEVAPGQRKTHVNSYKRQTVYRGKVDPGAMSCPGIM